MTKKNVKQTVVDEKMEKEVAKTEKGEQMPLIDVVPENIKPIIPVARAYKKIVAERMALSDQEVKLKTKIRDMAAKAEIPREADGRIKIKWERVNILITPRDELVQVTIDQDE